MRRIILLAVVVCGTELKVYGDSSEIAFSSYRDGKNSIQNMSLVTSHEIMKPQEIEEEPGRKLILSASATLRKIQFLNVDNSNITVHQQLNNDTSYQETGYNLGLTKGVGVGRDVGVNVSQNMSRVAKVTGFGLTYGHWWLGETFQTVLGFSSTSSNQESVETYDSDRAFLQTPESTSGQSMSVSMMHYTTPTTISRFIGNYGKRSDRPDAWSVVGEIRESFPELRMSLFGEVGHYQNLGSISTNTLYGEVKANSFKVTYNQRIGESRWIVSTQYRYFKQVILPRDKTVKDLNTGSDFVTLTGRYRLGDGIWTDPASELFLSAARYLKNSTDLNGDKEDPVTGDFYLVGYKHEW